MKVNLPHRHLRRSRVKRLMAAGWFASGDGAHWKHPRNSELKVTTWGALELQAQWDAKREAGAT